jgi:hypothetical protein
MILQQIYFGFVKSFKSLNVLFSPNSVLGTLFDEVKKLNGLFFPCWQYLRAKKSEVTASPAIKIQLNDVPSIFSSSNSSHVFSSNVSPAFFAI